MGAFSALVGFVVCGAGPNGAGVARWSMRCAIASKVGARERSQNRVSRQTDGNPAAAPPDEAAPTEPRRSASRPALPRRRVGQLRVAGDGAAAAPKGVPPCSSQVLPPAEPGSGRVARTTSRAAYTWHAAGRKLSQHPMLGGAALPAGPVFTILLHAGQPRTGRRPKFELVMTCHMPRGT
eukprot:COSAG06_NODE_175_length_21137_cov_71.560790_16_plen_180_part_00